MLCHWLFLLILGEKLFSLTLTQDPFVSLLTHLLYQNQLTRDCQRALDHQMFALQEWDGWHTAMDLLLGLHWYPRSWGCLGTSTAMPWQIMWITRFFATKASILGLWSLLQSLGGWLRFLLPKVLVIFTWRVFRKLFCSRLQGIWKWIARSWWRSYFLLRKRYHTTRRHPVRTYGNCFYDNT